MEENDVGPDLKVTESDINLHDMWVDDFSKNIPEGECRESYNKMVQMICTEQGVEPPEWCLDD